ncbi:hypothetical protein ABFX02_13G170633 [Erythranthe guttata]
MADNLVMEEREESMVSPTGSRPFLRSAHFLRPSVTSTAGPVAAPSLDSPTTPSAAKPQELSFKVNSLGWRIPQENWKTWVDQMHSAHHSTWRKAGIYDAVVSSKCCIHRHQDLIFNLVDKWCPSTNTMVFPWGEATLTLEDAAVLGGFSVLGHSVFAPSPEDGNSQEVMQKLLDARSAICKTNARNAGQYMWITEFMGSCSEIEHEAFLAYWLSRFVFLFSGKSIIRRVFPISVRLARGTKIALAPAVLAGIYKSLTLLKVAVAAARMASAQSQDGDFKILASAPLALVQVWAWERFPSLRPRKPICIGQDEPRLARWSNSKKSNIEDISVKMDSAGEEFQWRPYTTTAGNAVLKMNYYKDREYWAVVGSDMDEDLEGMVRFLRASELVGLEEDCIEQYLPHRVAMQFGMDQDLPGHVPRVNANADVAWRDYIRPIGDAKIYVPPRLFEADVTTRYFKWWRKMNLGRRKKNTWDGSVEEATKDEFVPPPPVQSTSSFSNEKGSCNKGSKRKYVESSWDYDSGDSLSDDGFEKTVAESSSMRNHETIWSGGGGGGCASPVVQNRSFEAIGFGIEERVKTIEKLCSLLKSGKFDMPLIQSVT